MIIKILVGLVLLIAAFFVVAAFQPAEFRIARSTTIAASSATIFARVNDLHAWEQFSPWAKLDPAMKATYNGPGAGVGASYAWTGNSKVGEGRMTITESRPNDLVRLQLEFIKPMAATNMSEFVFTPEGNQTRVDWSMTGKNDLLAKAFGLVMNIDKMVGADFEKGLNNLKNLTEAPAAK